MPDYMPHTEAEVASMLAFLDLESIDQLFDAIPKALQVSAGLELPGGLPEPDVSYAMEGIARANRGAASAMVCFAGAGSYDHEVPPVVRSLAGRGEFVTAYTPYQPEVAQGMLQAIFEFQTLVSRLSGLPVANASLYDGAASVTEAINLAVASSKSQVVHLSTGVHPNWRAVVRTFARGTGHEIVEVPLKGGQSDFDAVAGGDHPGVIVVAQTTYLGTFDDVAAARRRADEVGAVLVVVADPILASILKTPGSLGADVVVGEGQPLGTALSFGGPYLGLFACSLHQVRRLPGRLVGETVDLEGRRAYVTTLRAREQDIRREKATSNVCSNQTLMAVTAAIQLGWLGTHGLAEVASRCVSSTRYLAEQVQSVAGVEALLPGVSVARDVAITTPIAAATVLERLADDGFLGGLAVASLASEGDGSIDPSLRERTIVMSATEKRTKAEVDALALALGSAIR
ncbi:MAG: aminomethyl-transferring glycine dehydrogenase subunit GcvPA [Actinomycetes bacterium]